MKSATEKNENDMHEDEFDIELNLDSISDGCLSVPLYAVILFLILILGIITK